MLNLSLMHFFSKPLLDESNVNIVQNPCLKIDLVAMDKALECRCFNGQHYDREFIYLMQSSTDVIKNAVSNILILISFLFCKLLNLFLLMCDAILKQSSSFTFKNISHF